MFTVEQLNDLEAAAILAISGGQFTSISGGAKSGSKEYQMPPQQVLVEIKYARRQKRLIPARVAKVYQDYVNPPCPANAPNEQV